MDLQLKPDFALSAQRYAAFWEQELVDRPLVALPVRKPSAPAVPEPAFASMADRWLDVRGRAQRLAAELACWDYLGDALPIAWPNMGPEIFSAWCGCGYQFGETTAWSEPCIADWEQDGPNAVLDWEHPLLGAVWQFTQELLQRSQGQFIVGLTDFHPGADHLAALRDPQNLALDMLENTAHVKAKLDQSYEEFYQVYDKFYHLLRQHGMPITSWLPLIHEGRYYIPSNDFSCMISTAMFEEYFLPGLVEECRFYERSIYHLDGPDALRHLDLLLDVPELDAVQWTYGAGNEGYARWVDVYQKIQNAGKSLQIISVDLDELPLVMETLRPEGVLISEVVGADDHETAERVLRDVQSWGRKG